MRLRSVMGQFPWETDSEAEICIQEVYVRGQSEQDRGKKEKLN